MSIVKVLLILINDDDSFAKEALLDGRCRKTFAGRATQFIKKFYMRRLIADYWSACKSATLSPPRFSSAKFWHRSRITNTGPKKGAAFDFGFEFSPMRNSTLSESPKNFFPSNGTIFYGSIALSETASKMYLVLHIVDQRLRTVQSIREIFTSAHLWRLKKFFFVRQTISTKARFMIPMPEITLKTSQSCFENF